MSVFFFVWLAIALFLLGFWFWTMYAVIKQKNAWKLYAEKRKLRFHSDGFYESPTIDGAIDGYSISMFTSEHGELDTRSQRKLTAIEVSLHSALPFTLCMGSGGMVPVINTLDVRQEFKPTIKGWEDSYILRTDDVKLSQLYLNSDRMGKIVNLMKTDKAWVLFLFIAGQGVLRLDTPLPIDNPKEMDALVKQMINAAKSLELEKGEDKDMIRKRSQTDKAQAVLEIDEDLLDDEIGFELEEEDELDDLALDDEVDEGVLEEESKV